MNVPNAITLFRICSVPVIIWLIFISQMEWAFWIIVLAALSDALDGIIAKRFNQVTVLGAFLDPIADKALLVGVYVAFGLGDYLPVWLVIMVVFRDILIISGISVVQVLSRPTNMSPSQISKINTWAQLVLVIGVAGASAFAYNMDAIIQVMIYTVGVTTFTSGVFYVFIWVRLVGKMDPPDDYS